MQKSAGLSSQQQTEVKQIIECALLGFKASISNELTLLSQLLKEPVREKEFVLDESPIQPFGLTMESTKELLDISPIQSKSLKNAKLSLKSQNKTPLVNKKVQERPLLSTKKRPPLKGFNSVLTKKKL